MTLVARPIPPPIVQDTSLLQLNNSRKFLIPELRRESYSDILRCCSAFGENNCTGIVMNTANSDALIPSNLALQWGPGATSGVREIPSQPLQEKRHCFRPIYDVLKLVEHRRRADDFCHGRQGLSGLGFKRTSRAIRQIAVRFPTPSDCG
jgi:hypothetical protein